MAAIIQTVPRAADPQLINRASNGLALEGHDPVAYFTDGRPVQGSAAFEYVLDGTRYRFASAEHRDRFAKDPGMYQPQCGGFCSYAARRGYTADGDPLAWKIVDGNCI